MKMTNTLKNYKIAVFILSISTLLSTGFIFLSAAPHPQPSPAKNTSAITKEKAKLYLNNYRNTATPMNEIADGLIIEDDQLAAINKLDSINTATGNGELDSYRVYFGKDEIGADVSVVVGIDSDGKDMVNNIYSTGRKNGGLCPPMCDATSPITVGN